MTQDSIPRYVPKKIKTISAIKTQPKENKQSNLKLAKDLNRHITKENLQVGNNHIERSSTSYSIRGLQTTILTRLYLTPIRTAKIEIWAEMLLRI